MGDENYTGEIVDHYLNLTDETPPQLINTSTNPASPVVYSPGASYQFYSLWTDWSDIETVILEFDNQKTSASVIESTKKMFEQEQIVMDDSLEAVLEKS